MKISDVRKKMGKRSILLGLLVLFVSGIFLANWRESQKKYVGDFARICRAKPSKIVIPRSIEELQKLVQDHPKERIAILGGGYSHGGHTMLDDAWQVDMRKLNRITYGDDEKKTIVVEAGATWQQIQKFLDPDNLSVAEMQSYRNPTAGGSISVNCHGRGVRYGTIAETVESLTLLLADGRLIEVSRTQHQEIFEAVVGGYGGIAIIVKARLKVVPNSRIERKVHRTSIKGIKGFLKDAHTQPNLVFYNGNIYPNSVKKEVVHVSFFKTSKPLTIKRRLQPEKRVYYFSRLREKILRRLGFAAKPIRSIVEPFFLEKEAVLLRNYEMGYDMREVDAFLRFPSTSILQEYFIPIDQIEAFLNRFFAIVKQYKVNLLNISLRYVPKQHGLLLNYAPQDCIAVVLYINIWNNQEGIACARKWSQRIIDEALALGGTYYLPYVGFATLEQFYKAYPQVGAYLKVKEKYDPNNRFSNQFIERYLQKKKTASGNSSRGNS